ncbi:pancreatic lipase-related protein 2-like [Cotesia glomerata]|nr:pancreatic lipase-related protein 2-like [Cotesia glomerata]
MTSTTVFRRIVVAFTFLILILVVSLTVLFYLYHHQDENTSITKTNTSLKNYSEVKNIHHNGRCAPSNSNSRFKNSINSDNIKLEIPEVELKNNEASIDNSNTTESIEVKILPISMIDDENSTEDDITEVLKPIEPEVSSDVTFKDNQENNEEIQPSALKNDTESVSTTLTTTTTTSTTTTTKTSTTSAPIDDDKNITDDEDNSEKEATKDDAKCFDEFDYLSIPISWYHLVYRPFNLFPLSRYIINTTFALYTRSNTTKGQILNKGNCYFENKWNFDSKQKTKFIIHGYFESSSTNWVKDMKNELLEYDDYNVITVNGAKGSSMAIMYTQAVANTRIVGLEIAYFIKYLHAKHKLKLDDVHLIGHSLGAHTAGYAGEKLQGKIGRLSALDPAKPDFENMSSDVRLDPTDAQFVDVIHTSSRGFFRIGINHPCGHLDFYPNNGDDQPGCASIILAMVCNHLRAVKLFTESINSNCQFTAYECDSYDNFIEGECFSYKNNNSLSYAIMGYHADKSLALKQRSVVGKSITDSLIGSKFFISTGDRNPFCQTQYIIAIQLTKPSQAKKYTHGLINVTLHGDDGIIHNMQLTLNDNRLSLRYGETAKVVAVPPASFKGDIGRIRKVELTWTCSKMFFLFCCFSCYDPLYVEKIIVEKPDLLGRGINKANFLSTLDPVQGSQNYTEIISGSSETFVDDYEKYKDKQITL